MLSPMSAKEYPGSKFAMHCLLVFAVFMLIDFLYYGLIAPVNPYTQNLVHKIIWTIVLSVPFTYVFYRFNADWWKPVSILKSCDAPGNDKRCFKETGSKALGRGFLFGVIMGVAFIAIIALSCYVVMYSFIHLLDAFHGVPESGVDDGMVILKAGVAGASLAHTGKEESDVDQLRPPPPPGG